MLSKRSTAKFYPHPKEGISFMPSSKKAKNQGEDHPICRLRICFECGQHKGQVHVLRVSVMPNSARLHEVGLAVIVTADVPPMASLLTASFCQSKREYLLDNPAKHSKGEKN